MKTTPSKPLTDRQCRFVDAFLDRGSRGYLCATRAAAIAGYAWPSRQGPRLLTMPAVRDLVELGFRVQLVLGSRQWTPGVRPWRRWK